MVETALSILEDGGWSVTTDFADAVRSRGSIFDAQGDLEQALGCFQRCLLLRRKLLPPDHRNINVALLLVSDMLTGLGRDAEAQEAMGESTALRRRSQADCAGPGCERRLRPDGAPLDVCNNCRRTCYCSKACQTADWKAGHKAECKALIAAAAAAARK